MSQGKFNDTLIRLEAFKIIFVFCQKSTFFQGVSPRLLVKNDKNFEVGFFHSFMSVGISACRKSPLAIILKFK